MEPWRRVTEAVLMLGSLAFAANSILAQQPISRVYIGPPPYPDRNATDNGIPGTGAYAYTQYNWPSLRQALETYGVFGRKLAAPIQPDGADRVYPSNRIAQEASRAAQEASAATPSALLQIRLPRDAELWIADQRTSQKGSWRQFMTPPVPRGHGFIYSIRASWKENGQDVQKSYTVRVFAGDRVTVDLLAPEVETPTLGRPRRLPNS